MQSDLIPEGRPWALHEGDCIPHMLEGMPEHSVDCAVFSPPFPSLYAYTSFDEDIGNSEDFRGDARIHLGYLFRGLVRVLKPGRVAMVHVMQVPRLQRSGERGLHDFRGLNIRLGERAGLIYEGDWVYTKNPQGQAIRTKSHSLQFAGLERDRANSRGALPDYLIKFRAPGENAIPIREGGPSRNDWIEWAESCWSWRDIRETDTLNVRGTKGPEDVRHICPLQLGVIDRLVRLYSNPGEVVFSPFAGIGSEGYMALKRDRRFFGCEIKPEYAAKARENLADAEKKSESKQMTLLEIAS